MQKQQYDTKAVLLQECVEEDKNVVVTKYKVINDVVFMDGFVLTSGSEVREIVNSENISDYTNVVFQGDFDVKRIVWVKKDNLKFISSSEESWKNKDYQNEIKDKNENWFL